MYTPREQATLVLLACASLLALGTAAWLRAREAALPPPPPLVRALDLNSATWQELELLPGFGETLAHAVVGHRIRHGPYASVEELRSVPGVTERIWNLARPEVTVAPAK